MDANESGVQAQNIATISQEISCVPPNPPSSINTDANGRYEFKDLKSGQYCVFFE